ncbi:hypothetical protein [Desulfobulbus alkaliphilus]|uniref:hypothetical protein n=1 Tax=Desulfobulbus alkaliphilus TaxID=869814 RepID=UPI001965C8F1|nr:hypothetical protein [Desulfobulbus alkaliphilus]MBM9537996.1 hypothetical protein [Desulfobulbus alkaliphilus]
MPHQTTDKTQQTDTITTAKSSEQQISPQVDDKGRREVLKKIAVGTTALAGLSLLPTRWTTPLVEFGALPAHATTSAVETEEEEWIKIHWEGNPRETSESRDRTWWTRIHGGDYKPWHRKFPLPRWIDDKPRRLEFVFSDGTKFSVPNSTKMRMNSRGPKYNPEKPGERDPRKRHPNIAARLNATPVWVKLKVI